MGTLTGLVGLTRASRHERAAGLAPGDFPSISRMEAAADSAIACGFATITIAGLGALIYGFYSTCLLYYVKASVFFSAAVTSLR